MNVCSLLSGKERFCCVIHYFCFGFLLFFSFCFCFVFPLSFEMMYVLIMTYIQYSKPTRNIYTYNMVEIEKFSVSSPSFSSYVFWLEIFILSMNIYKQKSYQFDPSLYSYTSLSLSLSFVCSPFNASAQCWRQIFFSVGGLNNTTL